MNCKKCNAFVPDDSAFCPECGEKVEVVWTAPEAPEAQVFCPNCGAAMAAADGFCENCGYKVEAPAPAKKAGLNPKLLKLGIAAVAVIAIIVLAIAIFGGSKMPSQILYMKDDALNSLKLPSGKPVELTDEDFSGTIQMTEDGKRIFLVEDDELVYRAVGKKNGEATKVAKDVSSFKITSDGKKVFYTKNNDLYVSNLKDSEKIAKDVSRFYISADGKSLVYFVSDDGESVMYRKTGSNMVKAEAKKIATDADLQWYDEDLNTILFYTSDDEGNRDLYTQTGKKDKVKVASDATQTGHIYDDGSFYYYTVEEKDEDEEDDGYSYGNEAKTLYYYNGKKSVEVVKEYYDWSTYSSEKPGMVVYTAEFDEDAGETEYTYTVVNGDKAAPVTTDDVRRVTMNNDASKVLILADVDEESGEGTLYEAKVSGKKLGSAKKLAENISGSFGYLRSGNYYYFTDMNDEGTEGTLNINGKKVLDDASLRYGSYNWQDEDDDRLFLFTDVKDDEGTLYIIDGTKATKVGSDIYASLSFSPDGQVLVRTDYDDGEFTLNRLNGKKLKKLDTEVTGIADYEVIHEAH